MLLYDTEMLAHIQYVNTSKFDPCLYFFVIHTVYMHIPQFSSFQGDVCLIHMLTYILKRMVLFAFMGETTARGGAAVWSYMWIDLSHHDTRKRQIVFGSGSVSWCSVAVVTQGTPVLGAVCCPGGWWAPSPSCLLVWHTADDPAPSWTWRQIPTSQSDRFRVSSYSDDDDGNDDDVIKVSYLNLFYNVSSVGEATLKC